MTQFGIGSPTGASRLSRLIAYVIALLAWAAVIGRWLPMPGGQMGVQMHMSDPGAPEAMALSRMG